MGTVASIAQAPRIGYSVGERACKERG